MRLRLQTTLLCTLLIGSAPAADTGRAQLERIRRHMQERLQVVPNFTCAEMIQRLSRPPGAAEFEEMDQVRLEVAQVGRTELLAWPGGEFESKPLSAFVPSGLMSNGAFVTHIRHLFLSDRASFRFVSAAPLVRFDYRVPRGQSGYRIRAFSHAAIVGYHGSFWADPATGDVLRLEVYTDSIPKDLGMSKAETTIEYQRIRIGASEALLPRTAELTITRLNRRQERNRIVFSGCRQYASESVITYGGKPEQAPLPEIPSVTAPAGLRLELALAAPLDAAHSAIGAPVEAAAAEDAGGVIPKSAAVRGRVRSLRKIGRPVHTIEVGLEFTEARWSTGRAALHLAPRIAVVYAAAPDFRLPAGLHIAARTDAGP